MVTAPSSGRPLVTLFVTGFNQEATIEAAVAGAFAQTWTPLEIVLADDASRDGTAAAMARMAEAYRGPHEVRCLPAERNGGIVGNVNRVMAATRGDLVVMAGGDDVSHPERVERLVQAWLASGRRAHLLHSNARVIDETGQVVGMRPGKPPLLEDPSPHNILEKDLAVLGATAGWSRALFERFGPIPTEAGVEDLVLTFRGALAGPVIYVDEPLVDWRIGGVSWTTRRMLAHPFGIRQRYISWWAGLHRVALQDLARFACPDREACIAMSKRKLELYDFEVALNAAGTPGRLSLLAKSVRLALRDASCRFPKMALQHLLRPLYRRYWETRYAAAFTEGGEWR